MFFAVLRFVNSYLLLLISAAGGADFSTPLCSAQNDRQGSHPLPDLSPRQTQQNDRGFVAFALRCAAATLAHSCGGGWPEQYKRSRPVSLSLGRYFLMMGGDLAGRPAGKAAPVSGFCHLPGTDTHYSKIIRSFKGIVAALTAGRPKTEQQRRTQRLKASPARPPPRRGGGTGRGRGEAPARARRAAAGYFKFGRTQQKPIFVASEAISRPGRPRTQQ